MDREYLTIKATYCLKHSLCYKCDMGLENHKRCKFCGILTCEKDETVLKTQEYYVCEDCLEKEVAERKIKEIKKYFKHEKENN